MRRRKSRHAVHTPRVLSHGNPNYITSKLPIPRPRVNPTSYGAHDEGTRTEAVRRLHMLERLPTIISCWVLTLPPTHSAGQVVVLGARGSQGTVPGARGNRPNATLPHGDAGDAREGGSQGPGTAAAARSMGLEPRNAATNGARTAEGQEERPATGEWARRRRAGGAGEKEEEQQQHPQQH